MDTTHRTTPVSAEEVRTATFPPALRGYDRDAVHDFLDRVAAALDGSPRPSPPKAAGDLKDEFTKVGERTAGILQAAEDAASKLRDEARAYADGLRSAAEEESRKAKLDASRRADELVSEAEAKAERIIDEAIVRRRKLNQAVSSLLERRDEIANEAQRLADELLDAVDALRDQRLEGEEAGEEEAGHGDETQARPSRPFPAALREPDEDDDELADEADEALDEDAVALDEDDEAPARNGEAGGVDRGEDEETAVHRPGPGPMAWRSGPRRPPGGPR